MLALLLNWRVWVGIALASSLALSGITGYKYGKRSVQGEFDAYKTVQLQQAVKQQQLVAAQQAALQTSTTKVSNDYATKVTSTNNDAKRLADLRLRQHTSGSNGMPSNPSAPNITDATPKDGVLAECRDVGDQVAGDAQQLSDQVAGLQAYIRGILNETTSPAH